MFNINYYKNYRVTSPFASDRSAMYAQYGIKYGLHEGVDYVGDHNLLNLFDGVVQQIGVDPTYVYGKFVRLIHNPKFVGGVDEIFYSEYCHLNAIDNGVVQSNFLKAGSKIGEMGWTGHCIPANQNGMHLHFMTYQDQIPIGHKTKLLDDILSKLNITELKNEIAFWEFGKLFIHPDIMMSYFEVLQKGGLQV